MSIENSLTSTSLKEKKLEDVDIYKFKLYVTRYKKCKYGLYVCIAFFILSISLFEIVPSFSFVLFAIFLFCAPVLLLLMMYYIWKKRGLDITYRQAVWHELAAAKEDFASENYENTVNHLQNIKIYLENSKKRILPAERESEIAAYIEAVSKSGKQKDLLQTTFNEFSEILISDLHRLEDTTLKKFIRDAAGTDPEVSSGILQGRIWGSPGIQVKPRGLLPLIITIILVLAASLLFGIQVGMLVVSIVMVIITYVDIYIDSNLQTIFMNK